MKLEGHQKRLTIFIGQADHYSPTPLATEIVHRAHRAAMAGARNQPIAAFRADLDERITEGLVIIDDVEVVKYVERPARAEP